MIMATGADGIEEDENFYTLELLYSAGPAFGPAVFFNKVYAEMLPDKR